MITSGTSGIGFATARRLLDEGAYVGITGRDQARLDTPASTPGPTCPTPRSPPGHCSAAPDTAWSASIRVQHPRAGAVVSIAVMKHAGGNGAQPACSESASPIQPISPKEKTLTQRELGITGLRISPIGFGAWAIGGSGWRYAWGDQDDTTSIAAVQYAVSSGINWIDTAAVYGLGHSEEIIGRALAGIPEAERPYIFTKAGLVWDENKPGEAPHRIMAPASVRGEVEASLRRLRVDSIDLYQVHWPDTGASLEWDESSGGAAPGDNATPLEEYWQVMADLKAEGKVRAIGLSNHDLAQLERAEKVAHIDVIQPPFSAINRTEAESIAWAHRNGTGVIAYSPLQSGLLTGTFTAERAAALPANDWRRGNPDFADGLARNLALVEKLSPIAARLEITLAELSIAWVLHWNGVTGAIVGARSAEQIDTWIGAGSVTLGATDLNEIAQAITASGAGAGPTGPDGENP